MTDNCLNLHQTANARKVQPEVLDTGQWRACALNRYDFSKKVEPVDRSLIDQSLVATIPGGRLASTIPNVEETVATPAQCERCKSFVERVGNEAVPCVYLKTYDTELKQVVTESVPYSLKCMQQTLVNNKLTSPDTGRLILGFEPPLTCNVFKTKVDREALVAVAGLDPSLRPDLYSTGQLCTKVQDILARNFQLIKSQVETWCKQLSNSPDFDVVRKTLNVAPESAGRPRQMVCAEMLKIIGDMEPPWYSRWYANVSNAASKTWGYISGLFGAVRDTAKNHPVLFTAALAAIVVGAVWYAGGFTYLAVRYQEALKTIEQFSPARRVEAEIALAQVQREITQNQAVQAIAENTTAGVIRQAFGTGFGVAPILQPVASAAGTVGAAGLKAAGDIGAAGLHAVGNIGQGAVKGALDFVPDLLSGAGNFLGQAVPYAAGAVAYAAGGAWAGVPVAVVALLARAGVTVEQADFFSRVITLQGGIGGIIGIIATVGVYSAMKYYEGRYGKNVIAATPPTQTVVLPPAPQQQAITYQQPALTYQQPAIGYQQPALTYQQPALAYQQPAIAYQQPAITYQPRAYQQQPIVAYQQ